MSLRSNPLIARTLAAAVSLGLMGTVTFAAAAPVAYRTRDARPLPKSTTSADAQHNRFIVRYRHGTAQRQSTAAVLASVHTALNGSGLAKVRPNLKARHLRRLANGADVVALSQPLDSVASAALLRNLLADPAVTSAEPDRRYHHTGLPAPLGTLATPPNDPSYQRYQWHLYASYGGVYAPAAWETSTGAGVVVAVIDTGITAHPDLDANVLPGYDFITDSFVSRRPDDNRVSGAHDYGDWNDDPTQCDLSDSSFHGTHVAGTIAETTHNGIGLAGLAHQAKVLPIRVLGRCGGYLSDISDAIVWASGGSVPGVAANTHPAEVINMSLGGQGACEATLQSAIDIAVANGSTVVVAAGNDNADAADHSPASCANTITVGATRYSGGKAGYSNYGKRVDLSAPGGDGHDGTPNGYVWQAINDSATSPELGRPWYAGLSGTSMASPHVAATVALMQAVAPTPLTPAQVEATLKSTARPFPVAIPSAHPMGAGILNAKAALAAVVPCRADCEADALPIGNMVPLKGLSGASGSELTFALNVPLGATSLSIMSYGGTGDVALQVRYGQVPGEGAADAVSLRPGNNETARIAAPRAGTYYVKVIGTKAFSGVTLEARQL